MSKTLLNIALLGMSPRNTATFTYFIQKQASKSFQVSKPEDADTCIIDFDMPNGIKQWHESGLNKKPAIILSNVDPNKSKSIWVKKPINTAELMEAISGLLKLIASADQSAEKPNADPLLKGINQQQKSLDKSSKKSTSSVTEVTKPKSAMGYQNKFIDTQSPSLNLSQQSIIECCGSHADGDHRSPDFINQVTYDPDRSLLEPIKQAIKLARDKNTVVELRGLQLDFLVMPGGEKIFVDLYNRLIRHISAIAMQKKLTTMALPMSLAECHQKYPNDHCNMHHTSTVLWQVALWSARGRLPSTVMPGQSLSITSWPNFTRLTVTPYAIAMASIWVKNSFSPLEVAEQMQIPQRYVFAFISGLSAVDLIEKDAKKNNSTTKSWRKPQGFFGSILRSLKMI